jgi:hypothetical protein
LFLLFSSLSQGRAFSLLPVAAAAAASAEKKKQKTKTKTKKKRNSLLFFWFLVSGFWWLGR